MKRVYIGQLELRDDCNGNEILYLSTFDDPFAEELEWLGGEYTTVRYWTTDKPATLEQVQESWIKTICGVGESEYNVHYSDTTGYLWTDENLNIGGHDLLVELKSYAGKWLVMEVETGQ